MDRSCPSTSVMAYRVGAVVFGWCSGDTPLSVFPFGIIFDLVFGDQKESCSPHHEVLGLREHPLIIVAAMSIHGEASLNMIGHVYQSVDVQPTNRWYKRAGW